MLIKHKIIFNSAMAIIATIVMFSLFTWDTNKIENLGKGQALALHLRAEMLEMRRAEKDFMARRDLSYVDEFDLQVEHASNVIQQLKKILAQYKIDHQNLTALHNVFLKYQHQFHQLTETLTKIGLHHEQGLQGELRKAAHQLEASLNIAGHENLLITLLQLRRAEKDFIIRLDEKYAHKFQTLIKEFNRQLIQVQVSGFVLEAAQAYEKKFMHFVAEYQNFGLNSQAGIQYQVRYQAQETEALLEASIKAVADALNRQITQAQEVALFSFLGLLLVLMISSTLVARSIFKPIDMIRRHIQEIHQSHNLKAQIPQQGTDEISQIAADFNQMLARFHTLVLQVKNATLTLTQTTEELSCRADQTAKDIEYQRVSTDQVATAMTHMVNTIEEVAHNTESMAHQAKTTHQDANTSQQQVHTAIEKIRYLADTLEDSVSSVRQLAQQSQSITGVLNVIQEIAEQTNLLALNAAIEAARAGEQGRGFAVVADEVRALAQRTQSATHEISNIINALQEKIQEIVGLIQNSSQEGHQSRQQAKQVDQALQEITVAIIDIADHAGQIAVAMDQQSSVANQVRQNLVNVKDITEQAAKMTQENATSCITLAQQAEHLQKVIAVFKI